MNIVLSMRPGLPSRTAEHNALFRMLEGPYGEGLFDDELARSFLTWPLSALRPVTRRRLGRRLVSAVIDRRWPGVRASVVARTRLIDDTIRELPPTELSQMVILGAGFDSRPYRLDRLSAVPVFEVDHPETQFAKIDALRRVLPELPKNVSFVPSDFNLDELTAAMTDSGYDPSLPTVILWEGVTNYLSERAVDATLRWCAGTGANGVLLITYVHSDVLERPEAFVGAKRLHSTLAKVGEQLTFGMDPRDMGAYLSDRGLDLEWDLGASEYRARYLGARARNIVGHEFYRVALARIGSGRPAIAFQPPAANAPTASGRR
jgi:methyltransferase (TIGR00027 family)